jgi:CO dehydrogenase nickel-insertion accessory protein CooC1
LICTFYSYKGGVGRSMALANVGDILARAGLRVLMIDFDLEAPGLEQYFQVDHKAVRSKLGLFDLILRYKSAMSVAASDEQDQEFRRLQQLFITEIYPRRSSGGQLDLMTAGQRGDDEQLAQYALNLRQFDWQDFFFNWGGELFFEWLRRTLDRQLYDVVLVDSRTGVTEMGGICAYQLADVIVVLCASNQQNLEGAHDIVRNFFSPRVRMLRAERDLRIIVVPARVELQDDRLLSDYRKRFDSLFDGFVPKPLAQAGIKFWDLLIPYEPQYAFQERVLAIGDPRERRSAMRPALQKLIDAIGALRSCL